MMQRTQNASRSTAQMKGFLNAQKCMRLVLGELNFPHNRVARQALRALHFTFVPHIAAYPGSNVYPEGENRFGSRLFLSFFGEASFEKVSPWRLFVKLKSPSDLRR
jgi:hypothetical protein